MFVSRGDRIKHTPSSALSAGSVVVLAQLVGVTTEDIAAGQTGSLAIEGIFELPRESLILGGIAVGKPIWWDPTPGEAIPSAGGDRVPCGVCVEFSGQSAKSVRVKLTP